MTRVKKQLSVAATVLLMCFSVVAFTAPSASAASGTISGDVQCFYGNNAVVGLWVDAFSGTDGFASLSPDGNGGMRYSYTLSQSSTYQLHVGCSGTSSSWGSSMQTPYVNGQYYDWVCSYTISQGYFCAMS